MAIWYSWADTTATGPSTATAIWGQWTSTSAALATTSATTIATQVWVRWNTSTSAASSGTTTFKTAWREPTPAEVAQRQQLLAERAAQLQREREERLRQQEQAEKRAEELLHRHLSGRQRRQYRRDRSFIVVGRDGHSYKVRRGWSGHVDRLDARGRAVERFCIHPEVPTPLADNQLVAKLMLETDPEQFHRIANRTPLVPAVN